MHAYLHLRHEMQTGKTTAIDIGARAAEKELQSAEADAWKNRRGR